MNDTTRERAFILDRAAGYFRNRGVDVMAFNDFYPVGHQSGVSIIMHGKRIATNGDIRFEQTPGQWQPTSKQLDRELNYNANSIITKLKYPDLEHNLCNFNPMIYPNCEFEYSVTTTGDGDTVKVRVDLDRPIPRLFAGKLCFNLELFPGELFGKPYIMDEKSGIFPRQPNGPTLSQPANLPNSGNLPGQRVEANVEILADTSHGYNPIVADDIIASPYAVGQRFTLCPDDPYLRLTIESHVTPLKLYDGRMNHNNGWFVLSCELPQGITSGAVDLTITPNIVDDWMYKPVVQTSQVGYHPSQPKVAIIELDRRTDFSDDSIDKADHNKAAVYQITADGAVKVYEADADKWGDFLRYTYLKFDFSDIRVEGLYKIVYSDSESSIFRVAEDVYERGVWQPVLEYFLPVQMCHMRVNEKYRVWHGLCHNDDARMAPLDFTHIDGYSQGKSTLTKYQPGEHVPGLNVGGWHDAGDFDLRIESQAGECYILASAFEAFGVDYDATTIDETAKICEIHQPDGKNDILQQIEHGLLSIVGGYRSLGRLYRGIIANSLRQYVLLGDAAAMTDGIPSDDDRWVFTEDNPPRELTSAAELAVSSRAMRGYNDELAREALDIAVELYDITDDSKAKPAKLHAAIELCLTTGDARYRDYLVSEAEYIAAHIDRFGWLAAKVDAALGSEAFTQAIRGALPKLKASIDELSAETPYGIPYRPHIWGAGWDIQRLGFQHYFLYQAFPDIFGADMILDALNFVLGCHPGSNTASFASGVGTRSATTAYGINRADWSYTPGGVVSGTALIRPDFPELLEFPFLWQQTEYVLGGGSSHYMFLVLAAQQLLKK